jgi:hypothetical protein
MDWRTPKVSRNLPFEYFLLGNAQLSGAVVAHVGKRPIRETVIDAGGRQYRFVGLAGREDRGRLDVEALRPGEWIVEPNLVYAANEKPDQQSLLTGCRHRGGLSPITDWLHFS